MLCLNSDLHIQTSRVTNSLPRNLLSSGSGSTSAEVQVQPVTRVYPIAFYHGSGLSRVRIEIGSHSTLPSQWRPVKCQMKKLISPLLLRYLGNIWESSMVSSNRQIKIFRRRQVPYDHHYSFGQFTCQWISMISQQHAQAGAIHHRSLEVSVRLSRGVSL